VTRFSLPRTTVTTSVRLTDGVLRPGLLFTSDRVATHEGHETVLELLNRADPFFPFRPEGGAGVLLLAKAHTVSVSVHEPAFPDPARLEAARVAEVELTLAGGTTLSGRASFEQPEFHSRLLDFLNGSREPFFAVTQDSTTHFVNRAHVLYARPRD